MKIFYDKTSGKEIIDVSGVKSIEQIKSEFGDGDYEEKSLGIGEGHRIKNGKIETYNIAVENEQVKQEKETEKASAISKVKNKLGLTDSELADLKTALS